MGDTFGFRLGFRDYCFLSQPQHIQSVLSAGTERYPRADAAREIAKILGHGLVTTDGQRWRRQRQDSQPFFVPANVRALLPTIQRSIEDTVSSWKISSGKPYRFNATQAGFEIAISIAALCFLGRRLGTDAATLRRSVETCGEYIMQRISSPVRCPTWLPTKSNREFQNAKAQIDKLVYSSISEIRANQHNASPFGTCLLHTLLRASTSSTADADKMIRDQIITIFLAGFDTTAAAFAFTCFLLAKHPEEAALAQQEIDAVTSGCLPSAEGLENLTSLKRVILESLRLFPTVPLFSRVATKTEVLGSFTIKSGTEVWISPYVTHRHPGVWPEPECFRPSRWKGKETEFLRLPEYLPFGKGPHTCIGAHFAILELQCALCALLSRFSFSAATTSVMPVAKIALGTHEDIEVLLTPRTPTALQS